MLRERPENSFIINVMFGADPDMPDWNVTWMTPTGHRSTVLYSDPDEIAALSLILLEQQNQARDN